MRTKLSAETWGELRREGMTLERYAAMLQESLEDVLRDIARCEVVDPEMVEWHERMQGREWLEMSGHPEPFRGDAT